MHHAVLAVRQDVLGAKVQSGCQLSGSISIPIAGVKDTDFSLT